VRGRLERMPAEDYFPPGQAAPRYTRERFRTTAWHRELLDSLSAEGGTWAQTVLRACLQHLTTSQTTEAWLVGVIDAWAESEDAFCMVYRWGATPRTLGARVTKGDFSPGIFDDDPQEIGREIADYSIGEPLGTMADHLVLDPRTQVWWWGSRPLPPEAQHQG
jgi:hypothetical protein